MSVTRNGFQNFVNRELPPGQVGARASMNPRAFVVAGPGQMVADPAGTVYAGRFAWCVPGTGIAYGVSTASSILGFVANELDALIDYCERLAGA